MIEILIAIGAIIAVTVWRVTASRRHRWQQLRNDRRRRRNDMKLFNAVGYC
jgi:hypothetical protein